MSMTREEIIEAYESAVFSSGLSAAAGNEEATRDYELFKAGLGALRGPTREMVDRMRGEWVRHEGYDECANCGEKTIYGHNFCPRCGEPKTDEAVDMILERMEEIYK